MRLAKHSQMQAVVGEVTKQKETQRKSNHYLLNSYILVHFLMLTTWDG